MKQLHLKIHGRVQGVLYRENARHQAGELGLTGWVKNCSNGVVELVAQGREEDLQKILEWCKNGPRHAEVDRVEETWSEIKEGFEGFKIVY